MPTRLQAATVKVIEAFDCWEMGVFPKVPEFLCGYQETGHILDVIYACALLIDVNVLGTPRKIIYLSGTVLIDVFYSN